MSADNWAACPKCVESVISKTNEDKLAAGRAYGKVSPEEYLELLSAASSVTAMEETLREDYELGTDKFGLFTVSYGCSCSKCGFEFTYKHNEGTLKEKSK